MKTIIKKMGINGEGIGYIDRTPVFIPQTLLGEEVEFKVVEKAKKFKIGKLEKILKKNESRITPLNKQEYSTGGFPYMICEYKEQLKYKTEYLKESLIKYAQVNPRLIDNIIASECIVKYRNQLKLPFAMNNSRLVTGLYQANSNYFTEIDISSIHEDGLERVRKKILKILNEDKYTAYQYKLKKGFRSLIIRGLQGKYQVCFVTGEDEILATTLEKLMEIKEIVSIFQSVNTEKKSIDLFGKKITLLKGTQYLNFNFLDLNLNISSRSFFQLNTQQAKIVYEKVMELLPKNNDLIVEAYCGIGVMSLLASKYAKQVIGIEHVKDAVVNANLNAKQNKIFNVEFICADAADKLVYLSKTRSIDTLIVDPPRSGLDENMLSCILRSKIKNIVYVSCNPATLGKNLSILQERYIVKKVVPLDMFPQTAHVESIVLLERK